VAENARGLESQLIALGQSLGRESQVAPVIAALG
jgi:hypothetical protein